MALWHKEEDISSWQKGVLKMYLLTAAVCLEYVQSFIAQEELTDLVLARPGFPGKLPAI